MEIKQLEPKDKVLTFFGEFKSPTVESAIKEIVKINISDQEYLKQCRQWAIDNGQDSSPAKLTPIEFYLSTYGGACYDGLALHDVIESSNTPVAVVCTGKIMSMSVIVALGAKVRKAYRNTTFMIHQVSGHCEQLNQNGTGFIEFSSPSAWYSWIPRRASPHRGQKVLSGAGLYHLKDG